MNDLMTKSFLSYVELKKQAQNDLETEADIESSQPNPTDEPNLSQFFEEVTPIEAEIEEITSLVSDLETLNEETKSTHNAKVFRGLGDRIESNTFKVLRKAMIVKARLESLDRSNISNRTISELYEEGSPVDRTRISVTNGLRIKLREKMNDFHLLREKILSDYKDDLKRRYYTATGEDPSEEVIEKMILCGGGVHMFEGKAGLEDLKSKERHEAVMNIQKSLQNLHEVFLDMAVLVEAQGEKMDDIEENVVNASNFLSGGTNNLYYTNQMKKRKTWFCWVWAVLLIIFLVCIISMLAS